ncbi:MAG: sugar phosphate nucleotidyltransferase [Candidatus Bathyarchaeia archaeon]|nr:NTP transferase domain-containing protein [Candidatus Bathyarchaeota archaeon]
MKAVILAAGKGVRLQPLTENRPKQMLPVAGKPILGHILDALRSVDVEHLLVVVGDMAQAIKGYVESLSLPFPAEYIQQRDPRGTGHAAALAAERIRGEPLLLLYGDVIPSPNLIERILERYEEHGLPLIAASEADDLEGFGVVESSDGLLDRIVEKPSSPPAPEVLINVGIYVLTPEVLKKTGEVEVSPRGEIELTDALNASARGGKIGVVQASREEWIHIGYPWDLLRANMRLLSGIHTSILGEVEGDVRISGPVIIREGSLIRAGSTIEGPALIGEGSKVGPNAYIRRFTFLDRNVRVGNACEVKNSIIMEGTRIPHFSYVGDSVIGCDCNLGAGTMVANLRFDEAHVKSTVKGERVSTGERKFGAVIGDNVRTGINVSLMPGVKIGCGSWIGPGTVVSRDIPPRVFVTSEQKLKYVKL